MQLAWRDLIGVSSCAKAVWFVWLAAEVAITETHLQKGQISRDLEVFLVEPQSILVALDGLTVVSVCSVQQAALTTFTKSDELRSLIC